MQYIICDDDKMWLKKLKALLCSELIKYDPEPVITCFSDPKVMMEQSVEMMEQHKEMTFVFFLDIDLPGISGVEAAEQLKDRLIPPEIVYISAYDEVVYRSLHTRPLAFIRKSHLDELPEEVKKIWAQLSSPHKIVRVYDGKELVRLIPKNVVYIMSEGHNLLIYQNDGQRIVIRNKLDKLEKELVPYHYVRIHKRYLVNISYIKENKTEQVLLKDESHLPVSTYYRQRVQEQIAEWMVSELEKSYVGRTAE